MQVTRRGPVVAERGVGLAGGERHAHANVRERRVLGLGRGQRVAGGLGLSARDVHPRREGRREGSGALVVDAREPRAQRVDVDLRRVGLAGREEHGDEGGEGADLLLACADPPRDVQRLLGAAPRAREPTDRAQQTRPPHQAHRHTLGLAVGAGLGHGAVRVGQRARQQAGRQVELGQVHPRDGEVGEHAEGRERAGGLLKQGARDLGLAATERQDAEPDGREPLAAAVGTRARQPTGVLPARLGGLQVAPHPGDRAEVVGRQRAQGELVGVLGVFQRGTQVGFGLVDQRTPPQQGAEGAMGARAGGPLAELVGQRHGGGRVVVGRLPVAEVVVGVGAVEEGLEDHALDVGPGGFGPGGVGVGQGPVEVARGGLGQVARDVPTARQRQVAQGAHRLARLLEVPAQGLGERVRAVAPDARLQLFAQTPVTGGERGRVLVDEEDVAEPGVGQLDAVGVLTAGLDDDPGGVERVERLDGARLVERHGVDERVEVERPGGERQGDGDLARVRVQRGETLGERRAQRRGQGQRGGVEVLGGHGEHDAVGSGAQDSLVEQRAQRVGEVVGAPPGLGVQAGGEGAGRAIVVHDRQDQLLDLRQRQRPEDEGRDVVGQAERQAGGALRFAGEHHRERCGALVLDEAHEGGDHLAGGGVGVLQPVEQQDARGHRDDQLAKRVEDGPSLGGHRRVVVQRAQDLGHVRRVGAPEQLRQRAVRAVVRAAAQAGHGQPEAAGVAVGFIEQA